MEIKYSDEPMY